MVRADQSFAAAATRYDGLTVIEEFLTPDQMNEVDGRIIAPRALF